MHPEALTYSWFMNYFIALAVITVPFVVAYIVLEFIEWVIKSVKKQKGDINGKENDVDSR